MAYTPVIGDVFELRVACACTNQVAFNTQHYIVTSVLGGGVSDTILSASIDAALAPLYKPILGNDASYYGVSLSKIWPLPRKTAAISAALTGAGTAATPALPGQVCGIGKSFTANAGPKWRGRVYLPFPPAGANDAVLNVPTNAYVTLATAVIFDLTTPYTATAGLATTTISPILWNRASHTGTPILQSAGGRKWATQKRRGNYGQPNVYPPF